MSVLSVWPRAFSPHTWLGSVRRRRTRFRCCPNKILTWRGLSRPRVHLAEGPTRLRSHSARRWLTHHVWATTLWLLRCAHFAREYASPTTTAALRSSPHSRTRCLKRARGWTRVLRGCPSKRVPQCVFRRLASNLAHNAVLQALHAQHLPLPAALVVACCAALVASEPSGEAALCLLQEAASLDGSQQHGAALASAVVSCLCRFPAAASLQERGCFVLLKVCKITQTEPNLLAAALPPVKAALLSRDASRRAGGASLAAWLCKSASGGACSAALAADLAEHLLEGVRLRTTTQHEATTQCALDCLSALTSLAIESPEDGARRFCLGCAAVTAQLQHSTRVGDDATVAAVCGCLSAMLVSDPGLDQAQAVTLAHALVNVLDSLGNDGSLSVAASSMAISATRALSCLAFHLRPPGTDAADALSRGCRLACALVWRHGEALLAATLLCQNVVDASTNEDAPSSTACAVLSCVDELLLPMLLSLAQANAAFDAHAASSCFTLITLLFETCSIPEQLRESLAVKSAACGIVPAVFHIAADPALFPAGAALLASLIAIHPATAAIADKLGTELATEAGGLAGALCRFPTRFDDAIATLSSPPACAPACAAQRALLLILRITWSDNVCVSAGLPSAEMVLLNVACWMQRCQHALRSLPDFVAVVASLWAAVGAVSHAPPFQLSPSGDACLRALLNVTRPRVCVLGDAQLASWLLAPPPLASPTCGFVQASLFDWISGTAESRAAAVDLCGSSPHAACVLLSLLVLHHQSANHAAPILLAVSSMAPSTAFASALASRLTSVGEALSSLLSIRSPDVRIPLFSALHALLTSWDEPPPLCCASLSVDAQVPEDSGGERFWRLAASAAAETLVDADTSSAACACKLLCAVLRCGAVVGAELEVGDAVATCLRDGATSHQRACGADLVAALAGSLDGDDEGLDSVASLPLLAAVALADDGGGGAHAALSALLSRLSACEASATERDAVVCAAAAHVLSASPPLRSAALQLIPLAAPMRTAWAPFLAEQCADCIDEHATAGSSSSCAADACAALASLLLSPTSAAVLRPSAAAVARGAVRIASEGRRDEPFALAAAMQKCGLWPASVALPSVY